MSQLVCPMCSESLQTEGSHFYKHLKYKRYACGENSCESEFYTEIERNEHCTKKGHKRSFQKTVNPYMEKMISMVVEDARSLATKDMDTVIENRWGGEVVLEKEKSTTKKTLECDTTKKKRSILSTSSASSITTTTTPAKKKVKSSNGTAGVSNSPFDFLNKSLSDSSRRHLNDLPTQSAASNSINQSIVDSTTSDLPAQPATRKPRKKADSNEVPKKSILNATYEEMPAIDKLIGWFDPNVPERRDAAKVNCAVCNTEVVYDFIIRRGHVTRYHMSADVDERDYAEVLTTAMNRSYPDLPNTNFACQLCMTGTDIQKSKRREHIEKNHTTSLPDLLCPFDKCGLGFRRQCDLSTHMKEHHRTKMSQYKDTNFQTNRRRRNVMINEMINKCFPWSALEAIENRAASTMEKELNNRPRSIDFNFDKDVRFRDANRTRRAPQYDRTESSSSDSEDEPTSGASSETGAVVNFEQDVIFIGQQFNSEVSQKLSLRGNTPMIQVKREIIDVEDVVLNDTQNEVSVKEEVEEEAPKTEDCSAPQPSPMTVMPPTSVLASYEPIVPPPFSSSPNQITSFHTSVTPNRLKSPSEIQNIPLPARILSPIQSKQTETTDRSEIRAPPREQSTYKNGTDNNRHPRGYSSNTSSSYRSSGKNDSHRYSRENSSSSSRYPPSRHPSNYSNYYEPSGSSSSRHSDYRSDTYRNYHPNASQPPRQNYNGNRNSRY